MEEKRGKCVTQAEGQLPGRTHPAAIPTEVCPQKSGLRHLGMRTLVPFVSVGLVKCYTQVTRVEQISCRVGVRHLNTIIGQQS